MTGAILLTISYRIYWTRMVKPVPEAMVLIPGGWSKQGCQGSMPERCLAEEKPSVRVYLDPFFLDEHETTVHEYWECVYKGACLEPKKTTGHKHDRKAFNYNKLNRLNHPINGVNWANANNYCQWKGKRLPTESEFEFALRGGTQDMTFPWGEDIPAPFNQGNYLDRSTQKEFRDITFMDKRNAKVSDGYALTAPVCSFEKNSYGLCDISGNVTEWCEDYYSPGWYSQMANNVNPVNLNQAEHKVTRGCDWHHEVGRSIRSSKRGHYLSHFPHFYIGFRCAKDAKTNGRNTQKDFPAKIED